MLILFSKEWHLCLFLSIAVPSLPSLPMVLVPSPITCLFYLCPNLKRKLAKSEAIPLIFCLVSDFLGLFAKIWSKEDRLSAVQPKVTVFGVGNSPQLKVIFSEIVFTGSTSAIISCACIAHIVFKITPHCNGLALLNKGWYC